MFMPDKGGLGMGLGWNVEHFASKNLVPIRLDIRLAQEQSC